MKNLILFYMEDSSPYHLVVEEVISDNRREIESELQKESREDVGNRYHFQPGQEFVLLKNGQYSDQWFLGEDD